MTTKPPFPLVWDNTMRSAFVSCPQSWWWAYGEHFKPRTPSTDLHAGKAWAGALEAARRAFYSEGPSKGDSLRAMAEGLETLICLYGDFQPPPWKMNKSLPRLMEAFRYYWHAFPFESDPVQPYRRQNGEPMVEFSFALPLDTKRLIHPELDEPIIYTGRADMVATYAGAVSIYDDKTTGQLGDKWGNQWMRRSQFSGYAWAATEYGIPATQIVVRGIAILKTEIKHAQAITVRLPHHIIEWREQAIRDIKRAMDQWKEGRFDRNLADSCSSYGGCGFLQPCMGKQSEAINWLESGFERRPWNPLTREEGNANEALPI
jgi:PD-(D/E)XK nuclease superfamily